MSRSVRKPYTKYSSGSNKEDKRKANRLFRRISKIILSIDNEQDFNNIPNNVKEVRDRWNFALDKPKYYSKYKNNKMSSRINYLVFYNNLKRK